jgi:hypothetical protein
LLKPEEVERAIESNPFPNAESEPKTLHVHFCCFYADES